MKYIKQSRQTYYSLILSVPISLEYIIRIHLDPEEHTKTFTEIKESNK